MENSMSQEEIPSRNVKLGLENFKIFGSLSEIWFINDNLPTHQMMKLQMNKY